MIDHLIGETHDLWNVIIDRPTIHIKLGEDGKTQALECSLNLNIVDNLVAQNNAEFEKILICEIVPDEYNQISTTKQI